MATLFFVGDTVTWKSAANGTWKRKRGKVVEVVPANRPPRTRDRKGQSYHGVRKHEWYVVDIGGGELYYPRAAALRRWRTAS